MADQRRRILRALLVLAVVLTGGVFLQGCGAGPFLGAVTERLAEESIGEAYAKGQYAQAVKLADDYFGRYPLTAERLPILFLKAESQYALEDLDGAITTYELGLEKVPTLLNNVRQRQFSGRYERAAGILRARGLHERAIAHTERALRLEPQNIGFQILLGQLFADAGQEARAIDHFKTLASSPLAVSEERAVIATKLDRLSGRPVGQSVDPPEQSQVPFYTGRSIGLVPVHDLPSMVRLADVCLVLESSWRVPCHVLEPVAIPDAIAFDNDRQQYDGNRLLDELPKYVPRGHQETHVVALTGHDIFGPETDYVFSWQQQNEQGGFGVLSTYRFVTDIPDYYEPDMVATRRVAVQALSTTGRMFRFERPINPACPMAYPESLREFQAKGLRLCPEEERQRDALLARVGPPTPFGAARNEAVARVRRTYYAD